MATLQAIPNEGPTLTVVAGSTKTWTYALAIDGVTLNLATGLSSLQMQFRSALADAAADALVTLSSGTEITLGATSATITMSPAQTRALVGTAGWVWYGIEATKADGTVYPFPPGRCRVLGEGVKT